MTCLPTAAPTGMTQERTALPSTCTVQAPHWATPQPYLVPVRLTCSRRAHRRGVLGSTFTSLVLPLIVSRAMAFLLRSQFADVRSRTNEDGAVRDCCASPSPPPPAPAARRIGRRSWPARRV